jgi:hypothetical protein
MRWRRPGYQEEKDRASVHRRIGLTRAGTGLVCGHVPIIDAQSFCADFANILCPNCHGRGIVAYGLTNPSAGIRAHYVHTKKRLPEENL